MQQHVGQEIEIDGPAGGDPTAGVFVLDTEVTPELFDVFGARLLAGRTIRTTDGPASERITVVNGALAARFFGSANPLGRRICRVNRAHPEPWVTIVGVVGNLPMNPAGNRQPGDYLPFAQDTIGAFSVAARVDGQAASLAAAVRQTVKRIDRRIDVDGFETHSAMAEEMLVSYKMMSVTFIALGGAALFLAVAGLYAVMSFSVTQRTREIGIRLALGASASRVTAVVFRRGLRQIAIGIVLGSSGGWVLMRVLSLIPIGMSPVGPSLPAMAAGTMIAAGVGACLTPAVRTLQIDPVEALRHD